MVLIHETIAQNAIFISAIRGTGNASTKKQAAQSCSLSLVRQLFHIGAIEAAEPGQVQAKKQKTDDVSTISD